MRILLTGVTGYVGSCLVAALLMDRHQVLAATRNPARLKHFGWSDGVAFVISNVSDPVSVRAAFPFPEPPRVWSTWCITWCMGSVNPDSETPQPGMLVCDALSN